MNKQKKKLIKWLDTLVDNCKDKMNTPECDYDCSESHQQIKKLIQNQPEVDEEFIEKWIDKLGIKVRQHWADDYNVNPSKADLKEMLIDAGIKIKED